MDSLKTIHVRIVYPLSTRHNRSYIKVFHARDSKYPTTHAGVGYTRQGAIRDLGRILLSSTDTNDMTGRLEKGYQYSQAL